MLVRKSHTESVGVSESANDAGWRFNLIWRCTRKQEVEISARGGMCALYHLPVVANVEWILNNKQILQFGCAPLSIWCFCLGAHFVSCRFIFILLFYCLSPPRVRFASSYRLSCTYSCDGFCSLTLSLCAAFFRCGISTSFPLFRCYFMDRSPGFLFWRVAAYRAYNTI